MALITIIPEKFEKGKQYTYSQIELFGNENNYTVNELGGSTIGVGFIVMEHNDINCNISFVLSGYNTVYGNLYECIYTDLK